MSRAESTLSLLTMLIIRESVHSIELVYTFRGGRMLAGTFCSSNLSFFSNKSARAWLNCKRTFTILSLYSSTKLVKKCSRKISSASKLALGDLSTRSPSITLSHILINVWRIVYFRDCLKALICCMNEDIS